MKIYLASPPAGVRRARSFSLPIAHLAYRVSRGLGLDAGGLGSYTRRGLMVVSDEGYHEHPDADGSSRRKYELIDGEGLCKEILRECRQREFSGVIADFSGPVDLNLTEFCELAAPFFAERKLSFYARPRYLCQGSEAKAVISSSVSGGSYRMMLEEVCERFGTKNIALDIGRLSHDFIMPSPDGEGRVVTREELRELMREHGVTPFFSSEMCTNYFTYRIDGKVHFVLFDDAGSLANKIIIARGMGIPEGFMIFSEVSDILPDILDEIR